MKSSPFYSYLWKKNIFQQLSIAHKKQIQLPAEHKHDRALQWGIKTSHVVPERGRSLYWRTVTPLSKHRMSEQPAAVEQCQASPWWARGKAEMAFPGKSCNCCCSGTLLQAGSSSSTCTAPHLSSSQLGLLPDTSNSREKLLRNSGMDMSAKVTGNCICLGGLEKTTAGNSAFFHELLDY